MFLFYQIGMAAAILLATPFFLYKGIFGKRGFTERLGNWNYPVGQGKTIWFHAASMGELKAIAAIIPILKQQRPNIRPVVTTITKTGWEKAKNLDLGADVFFAPLDFDFVVRRVIRRIKPALLVLVETEIWPCLIKTVDSAGVPIVIANARLSHKSFRNYKYVRPFIKSVLSKVDFIMAQSEEDARRFIALGASDSCVDVYGNIKFDQATNPINGQIAADLAAHLSKSENFIFIAGSVREKEIDSVVEAIGHVVLKQKNCISIIAVRHLKNMRLLESGLKRAGLRYLKRKELSRYDNEADTPSIIVLDTMGELGGLYSKANLSFVGGSLVPIGGHDPLEPAAAGCAVCFGPYMENSLSASRQLLESGGARQVADGRQLGDLIIELSQNRQAAYSMGEKARQTVLKHAGVSRRIVTKLTEYI
ncbi:MAG: 3-deoxy-D-manno-octulosonic acid transferase [candidate division Zixibacteria bacterium]|nr:3-deoxy-D-manno-octulosonic acid transferase [candidate division Zixibacteria bacterium]